MSRTERVNSQTLTSPLSGSQSFQDMDTTFHYQPFYPQYTSSYPLSMVAPPSVYGGGTTGGGTSSSSSSSFHLEGATEQHPNLRDDRRKNRRRSGGVKLSTDPQSVAARERRHRISDRFKILQSLVPGGSKMDTVSMLEEAIHYVKFLKTQIWLHQALMSPSDDHGDAPALPQPQAPPPLPFAPETLLPSNPPVGAIITPSDLPQQLLQQQQQQQSFAPSAPFTSQPCWDDHPMEEHDDQMFPLPSSIFNYYN